MKRDIKLEGKTIEERLRSLLDFLNKRYAVKYNLQNATSCGASATFKGSPALNEPPRTITFDFDGKYADTVKHAIEVFLHEYGHLLLVEMGWRDYEQYCDQFADILLKELEVNHPEFLYGDFE